MIAKTFIISFGFLLSKLSYKTLEAIIQILARIYFRNSSEAQTDFYYQISLMLSRNGLSIKLKIPLKSLSDTCLRWAFSLSFIPIFHAKKGEVL
jgi:hypothetical protein